MRPPWTRLSIWSTRGCGAWPGSERDAILRAVAILVIALVTAHAAGAEPPALRRVDLDALPWTVLNPQLRIKTVVGQAGTFAFGEFAPGPERKPHHHTYEQINVGLTGTAGVRAAGRPIALGRLGASFTPNDVEHVLMNTGAPSTLVEFQPVRRLDLLPDRTAVQLPVGASAAGVPSDWPLVSDLDPNSTGWNDVGAGVRSKVAKGRASAVTAWHLSEGMRRPHALTVQFSDSGRFLFAISGSVEIRRGRESVRLGARTLIVSPPGDEAPVAAPPSASTLILQFEAVELPQ